MGWVKNASAEVNAESQYPAIIAICTTLSVLSMTVVLTRLHIRSRAHGLAGDDWMAALSMVFSTTYSALCIAQTRYGLGLPLLQRPKESLVKYTRINFAGRPIYQLGISFFKIALLISYLRLLTRTGHRAYRMVIWVSIVVIFVAHVGCALSLIFACTPVSKSWNPLQDGKCLAAGPSFTAYAMVTIISDVVVAFLPLPVLMSLDIRLGKKLGLVAIFALGLFTTFCSILRYLQISRIQSGDGNSTMLVLWGTIEFNVGNMVSSLPFLAPVVLRKAKEYRSNQSNSNQDSSTGSRCRSLRDYFKMKNLSSEREESDSKLESNKSGDGSEENIFGSNGGIVKAVTYSVKVEEGHSLSSQKSTGTEDFNTGM